MHPVPLINRLRGLVDIVPVAQHHRIAARAQLAGSPGGNNASLAVDDFDLDMRMNAADRADAPLERIVARGLRAHRARLRHAVGDGHLAHVHLGDAAAHDLDRARRASHDPGA
jgi:hypothetical protein